jgi:hypothetical protein
MTDSPAAGTTRARREYRLALTAILLVVLVRSFIYVFWERAHFDADQAITGLMAKHLAELRAFPLFYYGQSYMLAVEAWLAAPLFAIAGASVVALKLPLLAINMVVAWLLLRGFVRDAGLRPALAAVPVLFFALPAAGTAARLVEANGGNLGPFLYVLLIWTLRDRPAWCGLALGIGFLQREFTIYGFLALLLVEALQRQLFTRAGIRRRLVTLRTAAEVWLVVQWIKQYSSGAGPGTTLADVYRAHDNVTELASRVCVDPGTIAPGFYKLATEHWPVLFGTALHPLSDFGVATSASQGGWWATAALLLVAVTAAAGLARSAFVRSPVPGNAAFCGYLVATAAFSITGYVVGRCGAIDFYYTRYELLSLLGLAGLSAWFLQRAASPRVRRLWLAFAAAWFVVTAVPYVRMHAEYLTHPPADIRRLIIAQLDARGVRYAVSDYWIAYTITFLTDERIQVGSTDVVRIQEYERRISEQPGGVIRISREPCGIGRQIAPRLYFCDP